MNNEQFKCNIRVNRLARLDLLEFAIIYHIMLLMHSILELLKNHLDSDELKIYKFLKNIS